VVRLSSTEIAVVLKPYAPDPYRPRVRVMIAADGTPLARQLDVNLWEDETERSIEAPLDATEYDFDPLSQL
jgi:hypothetical protein